MHYSFIRKPERKKAKTKKSKEKWKKLAGPGDLGVKSFTRKKVWMLVKPPHRQLAAGHTRQTLHPTRITRDSRSLKDSFFFLVCAFFWVQLVGFTNWRRCCAAKYTHLWAVRSCIRQLESHLGNQRLSIAFNETEQDLGGCECLFLKSNTMI